MCCRCTVFASLQSSIWIVRIEIVPLALIWLGCKAGAALPNQAAFSGFSESVVNPDAIHFTPLQRLP